MRDRRLLAGLRTGVDTLPTPPLMVPTLHNAVENDPVSVPPPAPPSSPGKSRL